MRHILSVIATLLLVLPLQAQDARTVLDRTAEAFKAAGGVKISFTIRTPLPNGAGQGERLGTIRLKGEKFLLETEDATTWFDGHTQWSYVASSNEVYLSSPTPEELQSINPYALLSIYKQGFNLKLEQPNNPRLASLHKVVLTATDRKQELQCIIIYVTKDTYRPDRISMSDGNGNVTAIFVDSYHTGANYPDSLFVFDRHAYPSAELIDLR